MVRLYDVAFTGAGNAMNQSVKPRVHPLDATSFGHVVFPDPVRSSRGSKTSRTAENAMQEFEWYMYRGRENVR